MIKSTLPASFTSASSLLLDSSPIATSPRLSKIVFTWFRIFIKSFLTSANCALHWGAPAVVFTVENEKKYIKSCQWLTLSGHCRPLPYMYKDTVNTLIIVHIHQIIMISTYKGTCVYGIPRTIRTYTN